MLWRDHDGQIHALEDRCPHRGARLSLGWNLGDRLACWYHGIEVASDGTIVDVPAMESCPLNGQCRTKTYPVKELKGAIFVYFGDEQSQQAPPLRVPEELTNEDDYDAMLCTARCEMQLPLCHRQRHGPDAWCVLTRQIAFDGARR